MKFIIELKGDSIIDLESNFFEIKYDRGEWTVFYCKRHCKIVFLEDLCKLLFETFVSHNVESININIMFLRKTINIRGSYNEIITSESFEKQMTDFLDIMIRN